MCTWTDVVLLGGPQDGTVIPVAASFGTMRTTAEWNPTGDLYFYSFTEGDRDYYIHSSEVTDGRYKQ